MKLNNKVISYRKSDNVLMDERRERKLNKTHEIEIKSIQSLQIVLTLNKEVCNKNKKYAYHHA